MGEADLRTDYPPPYTHAHSHTQTHTDTHARTHTKITHPARAYLFHKLPRSQLCLHLPQERAAADPVQDLEVGEGQA
jgi:hypothetical protein